MCKNSNVFSLPVLIRREAWPPFFFKTVRQDGSQEKRQARHISTIIQQIRQQTLYLQHSSSPRSSSFFLIYFFPVSIAGLKLTFPSRTRSIRGLTTMVLHNRVWESSSMPGFFFLDLVLFFRVQGLFFTYFASVVCLGRGARAPRPFPSPLNSQGTCSSWPAGKNLIFSGHLCFRYMSIKGRPLRVLPPGSPIPENFSPQEEKNLRAGFYFCRIFSVSFQKIEKSSFFPLDVFSLFMYNLYNRIGICDGT